MPYVQRLSDSTITAVYARPQIGIAEEYLDDTDPAVVAYHTPKIPIQEQIDFLENGSLMNRAVREFFLTVSEGLAAQQGITPPVLYSANIGYHKIKDLDTQISALRHQL